MASSRHPAHDLAYRRLAQLCQLHFQVVSPPSLLTLVSVGCTVTELHSKVQVFASLDLTFSHVAPVSGVKEGEMQLLPLELKEKEMYFGDCNHRLWSQQIWFKSQASKLGHVPSLLRASVSSS